MAKQPSSKRTLQLATTSEPLRAEILSSGRNVLRTRTHLDRQHIDEGNGVLNRVVLALADMVTRHGAATQSIGNPAALKVKSSSTTFLATGTGPWLFVDAVALHEGGANATWRASVSRGIGTSSPKDNELIAECVQTFYFAGTVPNGSWAGRTVGGGDAGGPALPGDSSAQAEAASVSVYADGGKGGSVSDQRRRQIFLGACRVVSEKGYAATTIREIARASGLPIATMYQYIRSKEDILAMITSGCMEELFAYFEQSVSKGGRASDKIEEAINNYVKYISRNRKYINLVYRETKSLSRENREKIFDLERKMVAQWEKIIVAGKISGEFVITDSFLAANLIYFLCNVWALRYWIIGDKSEKVVREMLSAFSLSALTKGK